MKSLIYVLVLLFAVQGSWGSVHLQCDVVLASGSGQGEALQCLADIKMNDKVKLLSLEKPCEIDFGDYQLSGEIFNLNLPGKLGTQAEMSFSILKKSKSHEPRKGKGTILSSSMYLPIKDGAMSSVASGLVLKTYEYRDFRYKNRTYSRLDYSCQIAE